MPCSDLGPPAAHRAAELADLGWAVAVAHVGGELVDPRERERLVAVGVEFADGFLSVTRPWER
jgi:hypothetical protein